MKDNDFEPAKVVSRPEPKRKEQADPSASTDENVREPVPLLETAQNTSSTEKEDHEASFEGILDRFSGKNKSTVVWASPFVMYQNGAFNGLYKATVDQVASDIKGIAITTVFHAYLLIGYYLLAVFFDNDESKAFSKNPYKDTSINDLAKRDDIPFTRQKLTDCIKAAAVDMELNKYAE
jgi:hypothetical protein